MFFGAYAETLLFINNDKAEVFELHILGDEAMRADNDVSFAFAQAPDRFILFVVCAEATEHFDNDRKCRHPLGERVEVLLSQNRGRDEYGNLPAFHYHFESGAHRDFGFSVACVAADQSIHWLRRFEVGFNGFDRCELVGCFHVWK